jgi:branched-chain amino acid transport system permease protein
MEERLIAAIIGGIAEGIPYFLASAGLTLVFGVLGVLNFAHGAYIMVGAFLLATVLGGHTPSMLAFIGAVILAGLVAAAVSGATELFAFRRTYAQGREALIGLLLSIGLLLLITGLAIPIWGSQDRVQTPPTILQQHFTLAGAPISNYDLFLLALGLVIAIALYFLLRRSRFGRIIVAVSYDRTMASALGISAPSVSTWTFLIGGFLAGIGGAMIGPLGAINTDLAASYLLFAFVAIVIGGLGSIEGALIGSLFVGLVDSFLATFAPSVEPYSLYIAAAAILLVRPRGLFPPPVAVRVG